MLFIGQTSSSVEDNLKKINEKSSIEEKISLFEIIGEDYLKKSDYSSFLSFDRAINERYGENELVHSVSLKLNVQYLKNTSQYDSVFFILKKLKEISLGKNSRLFIWSQLNKCQNHININELEKAEILANQILILPYIKNEEIASAYSFLGKIKVKKGEVNKSVEYYLKADSLIGNEDFLQIEIKRELASAYLELKDYKKAKFYCEKTSHLLSKYGNTFETQYFNAFTFSMLHERMGNYSKARDLLGYANQYFSKIGDSHNYHVSNINLGSIYNKLNLHKKAKNIYSQVLNFKRNSNDPLKSITLVDAHIGISKSFAGMKKKKLSMLHIDSARYYIKDFKSDHMEIMILKHKMENLETLGDFQAAFSCSKKIRKLNWEIDSAANLSKLHELEEKYESEKKQAEIETLKTQSELDKQQKKNQQRLMMGGILFTSVLGIFFYFLYRNRKKTSDKLQEIDNIKTRFFENISHEFRTPLTLIKLPISKRLKSGEPLSDKNAETIHNNTSRLQNLVEDLLSLSELDAGKIETKKTEQNPIKQSKILASQFDSYASSKGINYTKIIDNKHYSAVYDEKVLDKVLSNLISNAIKYSSRGDKVMVEITCVSDKLKISVSDTGFGIAKEDQTKIFDRFYQVGEKDEGNQGSGIGLALVKRLVEVNNGTIEVESELSQGSKFIVNLPLEKVKEIIEVEPETVTETVKPFVQVENLVEKVDFSEKPQLLIVEDNEELSDYLKELFIEEFEISMAKNGKEGLKKAIDSVPNIIISDWMMPEMNGIELCNQIKTNSITSHIPFVLLTAKADVENKIEGYETGADSYFSKPFNYEELNAQLKNLLDQRKLLMDKFSSSESKKLQSPTTNSRDVAFWEEFRNYLESNIREPELSTHSIAEALTMSRMQLHRKLKALTGKTVGVLIKNQRMQLAKKLLKDPAMRVSDVCFEVGYTDNSAFTRAFKNEFGVSPSDYKKLT